MLKQRLITAFTLGPLSMWGILALPSKIFAAIIAIFIVMGAWEWARFISPVGTLIRAIYCVVVAGGMFALWYGLNVSTDMTVVILMLATLWWCAATLFVIYYPRLTWIWDNKLIKALSGCFVLIPCWLALTSLHMQPMFGPGYTLFVIMLMWMADSGAYFGGKRWGKNKLAQHVSPGKTREGVYAAMLVSVVFVLIFGYFLDIGKDNFSQWFVFMGLSLFAVSISIIGDLTESMFKRQSGVKDSGSLLPGHGGVLDRIDSLTAAAPVFLLGLLYWKGLLAWPISSIPDALQ